MEMVSQGQASHIHISFMLAGHTKFAPDRLFAKTGSAYKTADVFTIHELQTLCTPSASTFVEGGDNVLTWRDTLSTPIFLEFASCMTFWGTTDMW